MNYELVDGMDSQPSSISATGHVTAQHSKDDEGKRSRSPYIAVVATFTADLLERPMKFWMETLSINSSVVMAPYAQVLQQLLDPDSLLSRNKAGFNVLLVRLEDWAGGELSESLSERNLTHVREVAREFATGVGMLSKTSNSSILIFLCPSPSSLPDNYRATIEQIRSDLGRRLRSIPHVHCWEHHDLVRLYPVSEYEDSKADRIAHIPYSIEYFTAVATMLARRIAGLSKTQYKVIAIDCDNTLWRGICGEDGPTGVELTSAHLEFQKMLVRQYDAGVLLCLCTKNNPADVDAVFRARPEMPLRQEHLVSSRVNWNAKSSNLKSLAQELGLSLDSFIFVDDSPLECAEVRNRCPSVLTLQFPEQPDEIVRFVQHVWAFDRLEVTEDARRRTAQYKMNRERTAALKGAANLEQFLASLQLEVSISPTQPEQLPRVAELVQRTNQFNTTGIRRSQNEIAALCSSGEFRGLVVSVRDRFGDYGLVGAVLFRREPSSISVDTFVLSCRALGRGVEHRIARELGRIAHQESVPSVVLRYNRTARNAPAMEFLEKFFIQFRSTARAHDQSAVAGEFTIPSEYAENLGIAAVATEVQEDVQPSAAESAVQSVPSTQWHEAAFRLSRMCDLIGAINNSAPRSRRDFLEYVAPRTPTEAAVAEIWADILQLPEVSIRADFFDLNGDSLSAVQVIARIESVLGLELSLYEFFEDPTVEKVASKLANASKSDASIQKIDRTKPIPLSWAQQRLWFLDQLEGGSTAYHVPVAVRLRGSLNEVILRTALNALVDRHESLRTVFGRVNGESIQKILPPGEGFELQLVVLQGAKDREATILEESRDELAAPFDLSRGPLIRGRLLRVADDDHLLLITMHHIVSDGWSTGVLIRELGEFYTAYCDGRPDPLQPLPIQYADYAQWDRHAYTKTQLQEQVTYWRDHLQGAPELLTLPTDRPRPAVQSYRGGSVEVSLDSDLTADLKDLSRRFNTTLAMTLYTAWSILLSRLSGQEDIVVGMPVANRPHTEVEGLIGFFVNTFAVRTRLKDDPSVADLLLRTKAVLLQAYAHQGTPFEQVVEALKPVRSLSYSPIFQVMFVLQAASRNEMNLPGMTLVEEEVTVHTAQFDLILELQESSGTISGNINYATDLFDASTIDRWAACFKSILLGMVQDSRQQISRLPLMNDAERRQVIELLNPVRTVYEEEGLIHQLFEAQTQRAPDGVALIYERQSLTYSELNARANQLARYLSVRGIGPDQLVGICVERSIEMVVGLLGILKAGGAYVPIDPNLPAERLTYMLTDASPRMLLTQVRLVEGLPKTSAEVVVLDRDWSEISQYATDNLDSRALGLLSDHLAYMIYTSGSTGQPKGAMNEHRALVNRLQWMQSAYRMSHADRVLQKTPFSFDVSVWEFFWTLMSGASLVIARPQGHQDPEYLSSLIEEAGVTTLHFVPSMLQIFLDKHSAGSCASIQHIVCSGEELSSALQNKCLTLLPSARLSNLYGPTEAAIDVTAWECRVDEQSSRVPIGRPIANLRMYVLDRHDQPQPIGVAGEIYIAGVGVGRGYLNRPELTAERFVCDPFRADPQTRMYKTGDLGRWRADGALEYLGRNDHQVKIRGFRIELGEIEVQLVQHDQVKEAVVIAREDMPGEKRLVAYVVADDPQDVVSVEALRAHLKVGLPEYMVPSAFVVVERFPLTANGKLDLRALPPPELDVYASHKYEAPDGEVEEALAEIWQELLGMQQVGRHDNFFDIGGHSLLAIRALSRINQSLGCSLTVADAYRNLTIRDLAIRVSGRTAADHFVDLSQEAVLDKEIVATSDLRRASANPRHVMLTGGTGFVGRFLLVQLLQNTDVTVYCQVRAKSGHQAALRLRANLLKWDLWRDEFEERIVAIPGDLSLPRLGIDADTYGFLCERIDCIYHCATSMNHLETYAMAKPANVGGAREILKLATQQKLKLINYISTLSVFGQPAVGEVRTVDETTSIDDEQHPESQGYVASKWVSEKMFLMAAERSIPCNVFRLGLIWADAQHGRYDDLQNVYRELKSCLLSGYGIENYRYDMVPTPVDYAARAIFSLASTHAEGHGIFHISSSRQRIKDVFGRCNEIAGTSLELLPAYEWVCRVKQLDRAGISLPIVPLVAYAFSMDEKSFYAHQRTLGSSRIRFDCARTHRELAALGIVTPEFDDDLLGKCVEAMLATDQDLREVRERVGVFVPFNRDPASLSDQEKQRLGRFG